MWQPLRRSSDAWGFGRTCAENLGVNATWCDAPGCKAGGETAYEGARSTNVEIAIAWYAQLLEHAHVQSSRSVEIDTASILGIGRAVADVPVPVG